LLDLGSKASKRALGRLLGLDESAIRDHLRKLDRVERANRQKEECELIEAAAAESVPKESPFHQSDASSETIAPRELPTSAASAPPFNAELPLATPSVQDPSSERTVYSDVERIYREFVYAVQLYKSDRKELESLLEDIKGILVLPSELGTRFTFRKPAEPCARPLSEWLVELAPEEIASKIVDTMLDVLPGLRDWSTGPSSRNIRNRMQPPANSEDIKTDISTTKFIAELKNYAHSAGAVQHHLSVLEKRLSEEAAPGEEATSGSNNTNGMNSAQVTTGDSVDDQIYKALKKVAPTGALAMAALQKAKYHFSVIEPTYCARPTEQERKQQDRRQREEQERLRIQHMLIKRFPHLEIPKAQ